MVTHGKPPTIGPALERLEKVAREAGVELLLPDEEVEKHGVGEPEQDLSGADIAVVLVKPQFEAGRSEVGKGGVVRDVEVRQRVVREIAEAALGWEGETVGAVDSGLPGPKGNREVFLHLVHHERPQLPDDIDARIAAAIA